ncbi:PQQ-binding-like beta-propeller repeat protein [Nitratireductor luteus]|uniref:outer membrane protein assembly factor BamB family protein n=1 Tax=Nitratireductor luteus TaxID=2976980 RepID=UPI00223FE7D4|nr:PQQ-binding-like beta-propeller repeat protein [Nitratireductor luteus]
MASYDGTIGKRRGAGYWYCAVLGALLVIIGILLVAGGVWLITLGGSWYYLIAGVGLVIAGVLLAMASMAAVWVYVLTYLLTVIWAFWEVGTDWWAQVPRLVAPTIILILVLLCIPPLRRRSGASSRRPERTAAASAALLLAAAGGVGFYASDSFIVVAQEQTDQETPATEQGQDPVEPSVEAPPVEEGQGTGELEPAIDAQETTEGEAASAGPGEREAAADTTPTGVEVSGPQPNLETGEMWPAYGGTDHGTRYSPLDQINRDNVADLERVWEFRTGDMPPEDKDVAWSPETTPLKVGDDLYLCTPTNIIIAIDARTGREEWRYDPQVSTDAVPHAAACRGVAYFEDPEADDPDALCATRIIEATLDARLIAVDARLGQPCTDFGINGEVSLKEGLGATVPGWVAVTSPPTIVRGIAVVGHQVNDNEAEDSPSGVVRGYDAVTGELAWAWDLEQPQLKGEPPEGETYSRGTPNMWTIAAADEELGYVYLPLGNSAVDYYGSNRSEAENEYSTSVVAVDVTTGEDVWHFQTVYRDVWDYDLGSQPALVDFPTGDGTIPALLISSKQGDIYVLNRETGEPLFEPEERDVPQGGVEPDYISPVQPFSTYHTLAFDPIKPQDMWGMSPLDQLWCRIQYHRATYDGIYTPPTHETPYIQYPGYNGGQDWGSMAVHAERGVLIANYNDIPNFNRLITHEEARERDMKPVTAPGGDVGDPQVGAPYAIDVNPGWRVGFTKLMCKQPPYGGIRAIDLATGETLWDQAFGSARSNGPFGIPSRLPFTIGTPNNGGPIVTAGGLIFIAATTDNMIRAYDIETGEELWSDILPAGGQATPITYEVDGRQYLAFMAGGHAFMETPKGDYVWAWALPETNGSGTQRGGSEPPPNETQ